MENGYTLMRELLILNIQEWLKMNMAGGIQKKEN